MLFTLRLFEFALCLLVPLRQKLVQNPLQTAVLDKLTTTLESEIVSSNGTIKPGVLTTSNFTITVTDAGGGGVNITTTNNANGQKSTFTISQTGLGL